MDKTKNSKIGAIGEQIAAEYLQKIGYKIIDRNWHFSRNSELDIIALDKNTLVFVEVKTRTTTAFGHPLEAITKTKLEKIYMALLAYLEQTNLKYKNYRIDAISIIDLKNPKIEHLKNLSLE